MSLIRPLEVMAQFHDNVVIAHRGAWKKNQYPENSIAALREAIKLGCHGSEFDVHMTSDNVLVVNHDAEFYGLDIATSTYNELLALKHPNGEKIPTVEEYLTEGMKQDKTKLIFEIKSSEVDKERTLELTKLSVALVHHLKAQKWVEYICFDFDAGAYVHELDPNAHIAYLNGDKTPEEVKEAGYTGLDYHFSVYEKNRHWIKDAHELGLSINAWTVNKPEDMKRLLDQNAEFITTNEPELLFEILEKRKNQE
ncbi:glycerophosphodiester phosphodiesterase [Flavimarina sp. Hel_I_48]|uniref:glycerophosphodiester phosphodiesterase n=1 Tax=Flavimarina sp. Hel_I_48 TaxID=1392488 RepID=UPI001F148279|nr:glycerophosphodiester phosphodiesterase family protein [Flavimarina sp. Hel_I_48]